MQTEAVIQLTERQAGRLLERWVFWQGTQAAAAAAAAVAQQAEARYRDEVAAASDAAEGASVHVDFAARTLTVGAGG